MTKIIDYYNCPHGKQVLEIDNSRRPHWRCLLMAGSEKAQCKEKCTLRDAGSCAIANRWLADIIKQPKEEAKNDNK